MHGTVNESSKNSVRRESFTLIQELKFEVGLKDEKGLTVEEKKKKDK